MFGKLLFYFFFLKFATKKTFLPPHRNLGLLQIGWAPAFVAWPAMRVISLGIRTVPVLSVAKKLAAPRPTPTAPAAKCGLIRQHEADWLWLSIGCWKTFALLFFSSLLEVITGRGELTECSKLTCFAKRMLDMVPGGSGDWDRRSVSAAIKHRRRTFQFDCELGKGKNRPNTTYPNSKEEEKAILNARIQIHERVSESRTKADDRPTNYWQYCVHACMHVHYAQLQLQLCMLFPAIAMNWARVTTVSSCSSN